MASILRRRQCLLLRSSQCVISTLKAESERCSFSATGESVALLQPPSAPCENRSYTTATSRHWCSGRAAMLPFSASPLISISVLDSDKGIEVPPLQRLISSTPAPAKPPGQPNSNQSAPRVQLKEAPSGLAAVPLLPLSLGLAGAIPFVATAPPLHALLPLPDLIAANPAVAQAAYAACILSFLGAPHWGLAIAHYPKGIREGVSLTPVVPSGSVSALRYSWGVVPSLLAWVALMLPLDQRFLVLIPSFLVAFGVDLSAARAGLLPSWYSPLRITLTTVAVLSMSATALSLPFTTSKSKEAQEATKES